MIKEAVKSARLGLMNNASSRLSINVLSFSSPPLLLEGFSSGTLPVEAVLLFLRFAVGIALLSSAFFVTLVMFVKHKFLLYLSVDLQSAANFFFCVTTINKTGRPMW